MPPRLPKHLHDAVTAADLAVEFARGLDTMAYASNVLVRSAVERQLEILGEACRRALDDAPDLREQIPDTRWLSACATASFTATTSSNTASRLRPCSATCQG